MNKIDASFWLKQEKPLRAADGELTHDQDFQNFPGRVVARYVMGQCQKTHEA